MHRFFSPAPDNTTSTWSFLLVLHYIIRSFPRSPSNTNPDSSPILTPTRGTMRPLLLLLLLIGVVAGEKLIGELSTLAHDVSGSVYAIDDRTFEVRNFVYDGTGPAAYFWAGKGAVSSDGFEVPLLPACSTGRLPAYNGETVRVELPAGTTIADIDYLSVWCEVANVNFGDVKIGAPQRQNVPASSGPRTCGAATAPAPASLAAGNGSAGGAPKLIGELSTLAHEVSGSVYAIDDRTFEVRNLVYDGLGPAAYFWAGKGPVNSDGLRVALLPECKNEKLPQYQGETVRVELPAGTTINDIDYLSIWCETAVTNFGDVKIGATQREGVPASTGGSKCGAAPNGGTGGNSTSSTGDTFPVMDGYNCEDLKEGEFQVRWKVDGANVDFELVGKAQQGTYMGFGVSGSPVRTDMTGSDVVIAAEDGTEIVAIDYFLQSRAQCSNGAGVCADTVFGGNNDITAVSGRRVGDTLMVKYRRPVAASDANDKEFLLGAGERTFLSWALGPYNQEAKLPQFHGAPMSFPRENVAFEFGRSTANNCKTPIVADGGSTGQPAEQPAEEKMKGWTRKPLVGVTDITARIGPSGGKQGVSALTADGNSWGIAWYLSPTNSTGNDTLIPAVAVERGVTYTFRVFGGDNTSNAAAHHPLYITSDEDGGLATKNPADRAKEVLYAGITNVTKVGDNVTDFTPTAQGPLCELRAPRGMNPDTFATFNEYHEALNDSCVSTVDASSAGVLEWTVPADFEPEVVYYQCVTHRDLGFKLVVFDQGKVDMERLMRESDNISPSPSSNATAPEAPPANTPNNTDTTRAGACTVTYQGAPVTFSSCDVSDEMMKLYWTAGNDGIDTLFVAKSTGWAGLGWGYNAMVPGNAAIVYISSDGAAMIDDYALVSRSTAGVQPGTNQGLTQTSAEVDAASGTISGRFTRPLAATGIPTIEDGENSVIWAIGPSSPSGTELVYHSNRGAKMVNVTVGADEADGNAGELLSSPEVPLPSPEIPFSSPLADTLNNEDAPSGGACTVTYQGAPVSFSSCDESNELMKVYWTVGNDGIDTLFVGKTTGYAGIGWGYQQMVPGNAAIAYVSSEGTAMIDDYALASRSTVGVQPGTNQGLTQTSAEVNATAGTISGRFTRPLTAPGIPAIVNGGNNLIWAIGEPAPSGTEFSRHSARGVQTVNVELTAGESDPVTVTVPAREGVEGFTNNTQNATICVETEWLVNHGHEKGIAHRYGKSLTYCIEGLPCGTAGHLLRRCDVDGKDCRLVSYAEVCNESDARCLMKSVEVSRLRHGYDWSSVTQSSLELTSVSQHPTAKSMSTSRLIAIVADGLSRHGLGVVLDAIISGVEAVSVLMMRSSTVMLSS